MTDVLSLRIPKPRVKRGSARAMAMKYLMWTRIEPDSRAQQGSMLPMGYLQEPLEDRLRKKNDGELF